MKKVLLAALFLALIGASFLAGRAFAPERSEADAGRKILYYVDPMNPSHTSAEPGLAPCGMKMEPVYADQVGGGGRTTPPGTLKLSLQKQQLAGISTGKAVRKALRHTIRLLGKVEPDATRVFQVTAPAEGWITKAMPMTVGTPVRKDETLAMLYSPTFISAGQAFRNALEYQDRMQAGQVERPAQRIGLAEFNVKQYADSLRNLGVSDRQINDMLQTRKYSEHIEVVSPADGFMTVRNISEGQRFEKGTELYRIVDLSRVWVVADVFNRDAPLVPAGVEGRIRVPAQSSSLSAKLSEALPQFDTATRTLKLRFEADNPQLVLKPDMFVDVEFQVELPETLVAPAEAVLDSGLRKTVFVDAGNGHFEPRTVQTGWRVGDHVEITRGLMDGERIVTSGNFLLDSESRMKLAASGVQGTPLMDPVCGMAVDEVKARTAKRTIELNGVTWFFCNDGCRKAFEAEPSKFQKQHEPEAASRSGESVGPAEMDLVCGMTVNPKTARAAGRTAKYKGKTYFFCNDGCREEFQADSARFLTSASSVTYGHDQSHH